MRAGFVPVQRPAVISDGTRGAPCAGPHP